ncbi:ATP-binding protein [Mycoplasma buteonis]|uniref:ATP-binding protein n=1 Tax=Mycoplasma buteonis TaxID=171280 RepID=UPI00056430A5|nr:ATP-binding protein [Mycoplasma buteonis]
MDTIKKILNRDGIFTSREDLIISLKQFNPIKKVISKYQISDSELWDNFVQMSDYLSEQQNPDDFVYSTKIQRDLEGNLIFDKKINSNEKAKKYLLTQNIFFKNISKPVIDKPITEIEWIDDVNHFDLFEFIINLKNKLEKTNNLKKIRGCFIDGESSLFRNQVLSAFANFFAINDYSTAYLNVNYLEDELKKSFNSSDSDINYILDTLSKLDVLILDEIGFKTYNPWFFENILIKILENRYINQKTTFIGSYVDLMNIEKNISNKEKRISKIALTKFRHLVKQLCQTEIWVGK